MRPLRAWLAMPFMVLSSWYTDLGELLGNLATAIEGIDED